MNSDFCVAVHALVYLNRRGCVLSSEELARNICTNPARVRKVLARMKKDGLVETKEGSSGGGYRFAKGAGEVSLAQVARALEVRFVSTSWHSGSQEVKCLVATGMAQVMDALFDDLDDRCMARLEEIKRANKETFARWAYRQQGVQLNTDAIFNVQVKRLHEYKRQLLNVLHIIALYQQLQDDPDMDFPPQTFLFGAKAAPGYAVAKRIIRLINSLADQVNNDPICKGKLQVVFLENYRVSMAEMLMPASEVSQQISTAGKEASGTGNMKFMMNGALTIGTLDGANVEMHEVLGDENMFLFGLTAEEASHMSRGYDPYLLYTRDPVLRRALDQLKAGFRDGVSYEDLYQRLLFGVDCPADQYLLLADFASYCAASQRVTDTYRDREKWNRMSLHNIARSGIFSADRSVADYADTIWHVPYKK